MGIQLAWNDKRTVLYQTFNGDWTLQAYYHSIAALEVMTAGCHEDITLIMDMRNAPTPSLRMPRGRNINEAEATRNIKQVVIVDAGYFMPLVDCPVYLVNSIEEALLYVNQAVELPHTA